MINDTEREPSMADFNDLIDAGLSGYRSGFEPGERVQGRVLHVTPSGVLLDVNAKREGIMPLDDVLDADGNATVAPGDTLEAWFVGMQNGAFRFSKQLSGDAAMERGLTRAIADGMPVEGVVKAERKGGYEVDVFGNRAFCPFSQMNLHRTEGEEFVGRRMLFMVAEYDAAAHNLVLSRRALLEREREQQRDALALTLREGDQVTGRVTKLMDFGVFVDIGGVDGLVPMRELSWQRNARPEDLVAEGDTVQVMVRELDWERNRVGLSLRDAQGDPWSEVDDRFPPGTEVEGRVTRLERFGALVEIIPGVEGLVPIASLGRGRRLSHAREVWSDDQRVQVRVESVDLEARRMRLSPLDAGGCQDRPGKAAGADEAATDEREVREWLRDRQRREEGALGNIGSALDALDL